MKICKVLLAAPVFFMPVFVFADPMLAELATLTTDATAQLATDPNAFITVFGVEVGGILASCLITACSIIGLASALVKILVPITKWTENTFDDVWLLKITKFLAMITGWMDKYVALNPNKNNARHD